MNEADRDRTGRRCFYFASSFVCQSMGLHTVKAPKTRSFLCSLLPLLSMASIPRWCWFLGGHFPWIPATPGLSHSEPKADFCASVDPDPARSLYSAKQAMVHFLLLVLPFQSLHKRSDLSVLCQEALSRPFITSGPQLLIAHGMPWYKQQLILITKGSGYIKKWDNVHESAS